MKDTNKTKLIDEIIEVQRAIDRSRRQYETDIWVTFPLTRAQIRSLFFISIQKGTCLVDLAHALGVTPANANSIVDRLVKQGLLSRTEDSPDRKMAIISTTNDGEEFVSNIRLRVRDYWKKVLSGLKPEELYSVMEGLTLTAKAIEDYETEFPEDNI
jgi:DNA-binding MarR family transcriptional regulator